MPSIGDDRSRARPGGKPRCTEFGRHPSATERAAGACNCIQRAIVHICSLDERRIRALTGVTVHQPVLIRENQQGIGIHQISHQCRQGVVVSQTNFIRHDRVVFVHDRQHVHGQ